MIEILTLMLGLVMGITEVELAVGPGVQRVEVRVDNEMRVELEGPPWSFEVDWGDEILPRELTVVAFNTAGKELGRDQRWINSQGRTAMASLLFPSPNEQGRVSHAEARWASVGMVKPKSISALFDDKPVSVSRTGRIELPKYDPTDFHWLTVEVDFGRGGTQVLGAALGGENLVELSTDLTAVPVQIGASRSASELDDNVLVNGRPAAIHGVEKGIAEVVAVIDQPAAKRLGRLIELFSSGTAERLLSKRRTGQRGLQQSKEVELAEFGRLGRRTNLRFLWPRADIWPGNRLDLEMFASGPPRSLQDSGFLAAVHRERRSRPESADQLSAAVALAGVAAAGSSRRRAVVLMAGNLTAEEAELVARVTRFLRVLRVPLYVWSVGTDVDPGPWPVSHPLGDPVADTSAVKSSLSAALEDLRRDLGQQRIVWIEGRHLPQTITLGADLNEVRSPPAHLDGSQQAGKAAPNPPQR